MKETVKEAVMSEGRSLSFNEEDIVVIAVY